MTDWDDERLSNTKKGGEAAHFSFRLHSSYETEAKAMELVAGLRAKGWELREIFTDAVLRASGHTPEMFARQNRTTALIENLAEDMQGLKSEMQRMFTEELKDILKTIRDTNPQQLSDFATDPEAEVDDDWAVSMSQSIKRRKRNPFDEDGD